jgi:hypothetical protein
MTNYKACFPSQAYLPTWITKVKEAMEKAIYLALDLKDQIKECGLWNSLFHR